MFEMDCGFCLSIKSGLIEGQVSKGRRIGTSSSRNYFMKERRMSD
jgi:hypothetical protein